MLAEINIDVEINNTDGNTATDRLGKKQFTATQLSWAPRPDPDGNLRRHFYSSSPLNYQSYNNPKVDELLDLTRKLPNGDQRVQAFRDMQKLIVDDEPWLFVVFENQTAGMLSRVQDLPPIPDTLMRTKGVWLSA
jgi:peptide/nickel transport system substrate-binding protein